MLATLWATGTTLNVMSLMGVVMMVGIVVSNSIPIVEFVRRLREDGMELRNAVIQGCRVRLRPVLMTSLATLIGLLPMALKMGTGSEAYAPSPCRSWGTERLGGADGLPRFRLRTCWFIRRDTGAGCGRNLCRCCVMRYPDPLDVGGPVLRPCGRTSGAAP